MERLLELRSPSLLVADALPENGVFAVGALSNEEDRGERPHTVPLHDDLVDVQQDGMPETAKDRLKISEKLINGLLKHNVPLENIYVDPLVQPISTKDDFGVEFLDAVDAIMTRFQGVHTICGLSNISYGLPMRKLMNREFAVMAVARGLDSLIVNPLDRQMMSNLITAETLAGGDKFCTNFLQAYRGKKFEL